MPISPLVLLAWTFAQADAPAVPPADDVAAIEKALATDAAAQPTPPPVPTPIPEPPPSAVGPTTSALMNPDISFILDMAGAWFSAKDPLQAGDHDPHKNGFALQQLEMSIGHAVDPYFRFDSNIVFSQEGVEIEEAYATTLALPYNLQLRAGQFLTRMGRLNATHPHAWDFVDQPFSHSRLFGGEGNRGLGVEASYLTPLPWYVELVFSVTDAVGEGTARSFFGAQDPGVHSLLDFENMAAVKQFFPLGDDLSLSFGLSGAFGPNANGPNARSEIYGTDLYLKYRPITFGSYTIVSLQTEWFYRRRDIPDDVLSDVNGYAYLFWRMTQRWGTAVRYEYGSPSYNRHGDVGADLLDPSWTGNRQRISANLTFWPTEFSRLRLQGSSDVLGWGDNGRTVNWAALLALEVVVGAHGAHKF